MAWHHMAEIDRSVTRIGLVEATQHIHQIVKICFGLFISLLDERYLPCVSVLVLITACIVLFLPSPSNASRELGSILHGATIICFLHQINANLVAFCRFVGFIIPAFVTIRFLLSGALNKSLVPTRSLHNRRDVFLWRFGIVPLAVELQAFHHRTGLRGI
jgi:hypothetical protein